MKKSRTKITDEIRKNVIKDHENNYSNNDIATKYNISIVSVYRILKNNNDINRNITNDINRNITNDKKVEIAIDYESGNYTYKDLQEKYNISYSSVYRILKEFDVIGKTSKTKKEKVNSNIETEELSTTTDTPEIVESKEENKRYYTAGLTSFNEAEKIAMSASRSVEFKSVNLTATQAVLCADRHNIKNINTFIYNTLDSNQMFDYNYLYNIATEFIKDKCKNKILHLYCTGIQCALAAVIKAAYDLKCNLTLFHYNNTDFKYYHQDIWEFAENKDVLEGSLSELIRKGPVYRIGSIDENEFYILSVKQCKKNSSCFYKYCYIIADSLNTAFDLYYDYVKAINMDMDTKKAVFILKCKIENGKKLVITNTISKAFNK